MGYLQFDTIGQGQEPSIFVSLICHVARKLKQLEIKTDYLNAGIVEESFVDQPPSFVKKNANNKNKVLGFKKLFIV